MRETVLDPRTEAAESPASADTAISGGKLDTEALSTLEARVLREVEARLANLQQGTVEAAATLIAERVDSLIEAKVKKAISGSFLASTDRMKDAVLKVMQAVLLESGLLERFIQRAVESKMQGIASGKDGGVKGTGAAPPADLRETIQKEVSRALAGEELKSLVDEKFRAITLYLKSDVIPKAVQQALESPAPPRAGT